MSDVANAMKMPPQRQASCERDYANISTAWEALLKPHMRDAELPKTKIEVTYGEGKGNLDVYAEGFRSLQMLEIVAERAAELFAWPAPLSMEMQSCGFNNASWNKPSRTITLCYELAADFAQLYRDFELARRRIIRSSKRK